MQAATLVAVDLQFDFYWKYKFDFKTMLFLDQLNKSSTFGPKYVFSLECMSGKDESIKAEILAEAQKLFIHYGWAKTTMEDIAKAAGKGKSTLYYYYKSKDEIFDEVVTKEMDEVFRTLQEEVGKVQTAEEKLTTFSLTKLELFQKKTVLKKIVLREEEANISRLIDLNRRYEIREIRLVRNILNFGLEKGEFTGYKANDADAIAFAMVCSMRGLEIGLMIEDRYADLESRIDILNNLMLRGLKV
ncbi:TetR/AcrR family transcriptional regulator [Pontibacter kalidii]|uniref:TetR/AcrR family transcriptional regulator n=1 Tax=Pontibacter kalidii TaxID=2592049 RepID=UPI002250BE25|nr:TetR/AcrR family transcriptional regulator [Pontibacter kalidii]